MNSGNDVEQNFTACEKLVETAAARNAAMLCLPECFAFIGASPGAGRTSVRVPACSLVG
jgi:predicted amidohydrolase